jgi:hypothetical protein
MSKKEEKTKALKALDTVINNKTDVKNAFMCELGSVDLVYGKPGNPEKDFRKGSGVIHIITKRDFEHKMDPKRFRLTGLQLVRKLMDVIVYGNIVRVVKTKQTVHIAKDGYEAVISQNWCGISVNWLLTGYKVTE